MIPENRKNWEKKNIWLGLSGGVDSTVAALKLKVLGAKKVKAVFMKNWDDDDTEASCYDKQDMITAASVAEALNLDFEVVNFVKEYKEWVFNPFIQELEKGVTPNPDVWCNRHIKFFAFAQLAHQRGADYLATGHYARCFYDGKKYVLSQGEDLAKDQTYFLYRLTQQQLKNVLFPIGEMHKSEVREQAQQYNLPNWSRKDSTGICFIGERKFSEFISRYIDKNPGEIRDKEGHLLGTHDGLMFYTIGQRKGLKIGGEGEGWFVVDKDIKNNILVVVQGKEHPDLYATQVFLKDVHWIAGVPPPTRWVYSARLRHGHFPASCTLIQATENTATLVFADSQRVPTPGQHAVVYDGSICLGGGVIVSSK